MPVLSKLSNKTVLIGSACFIIGLGLGVFIEQLLLWDRQVGRFNELIRRLAIIEDEIRHVKIKLRRARHISTEVDGILPISSQVARRPSQSSDEDEFLDPESEVDEFMSVTSDFSSYSLSSSHEIFFNEIDGLLDGSFDEKQRAYNNLRDKRIKFADNVEFLWRWARAGYLMYEREGGCQSEIGKQYIYEAQGLIEKALKISDQSSDAHKWYAVIIGSIGECEGTKKKIENGFEFKKHIDRSLELNPEDFEAHYLNGRFCYGVYMLTWLERQMASAVFATPPTATIEDALAAFTECENLNPNGLKKNQLYLARCYEQLGDTDKALAWLEKANANQSGDEFDADCQSEVEELLIKYRGE